MKLLVIVASVAVLAATVYAFPAGDRGNAQCPQFWVLFNSACYRYFGDRVSWETANSRCRDIYTHRGRAELVSIHNEEENSFAYDLFRTSAGDTPTQNWPPYGAWIGFHQTTVGSTGPFVWSDGSDNTDFDSWLGGQPDNHGANEDCAHFWRRSADDDETQTWNDAPCETEVPYICKVEPNY